MIGWVWRWARRIGIGVLIVLATLLTVRAVDAWRGPPLEPWHTFVPKEMSRAELATADLAAYRAAEDKLFDAVRTEVTDKLPPRDRERFNRYFAQSPVYPGHFAQDFNRTFVLQPEGEPVGAAVFLHGLTDSPYSLRHLARRYAAQGFLAIALRLPGHGTVPGALTAADYEDWIAATRLAMREARRQVGPHKSIHIVGYSNGGALALMHALDALDDPTLVAPAKIVLVSPMVGVTRFARFAGVAGWPAVFPAFAKASWLSIVPEFNPFKYNSFPVQAARQSFLLTQALQANIDRHLRGGRLAGLAPVLTFQSVLDHTVSTRAVIDALHTHLDDNGSELVLFDINRNTHFEQLLNAHADTALSRLLPPAPRPFRTAVVTNVNAASEHMEVRVTPAGATEEEVRPLALAYPPDVYSLSHVAVPFPLTDGLYGLTPDPHEGFGVRLGDIAARGEYGALIVNVDMLVRMSSNPFFPYLLERLDAGLPPRP
ncbi:alpha/beta hydrolase [Xanthobacter agilis]|uniref:Alpha-beta hydrolase superfamily lysophospholipase n=1 Tax=Xanthobacter agilis TaxID=47492 RepID=A0ABU0LC05_XANAG|nr:alpha/beta fold hydrolase [Xanthobacter agilis]MDQ0504632.1 alpha-beta hydrolase superfamily lysophospholipase [Xanthobacter agilis]